MYKKTGFYNQPGIYISYFYLLQPNRPPVHIASNILDEKIDISNQTGL